MKYLLILLLPILIFANNEYQDITNIQMKKEGNITKITQINKETFEYFTLYVDKETAKVLNTECKVKVKKDNLSLTKGKPFICYGKYYEFLNKNEYNTEGLTQLSNILLYEGFFSHIGMIVFLIGSVIFSLLYMITEKPIFIFGILFSMVTGFIIGLSTYFGWINVYGSEKQPYTKEYLIKYYDNIEKINGYKVFRKGFYKDREED